ncbi:neutral/alkaline non-lysosomal ceramidase N-terminal domain-containing protein [Psychrobacter sp. KFRI-CH2-11]|uniref:neutral/alkaline non-lysosomal ceramidase N-terminal domain-containing protein n=1 Tax=Psychrobacter sp. KFRI-CH2-11 TaxID=3156079 RepID=UPI003250BF92
MATSSISPPSSRRPTMLFLSICTALLGMTACETDSTEPTVMSPAATQTITTDADPSNRSITSNFSASAVAESVAHRYLVGTGKADITGAAAETGMFGYAAGQVVQGINDRLYSHAFIVGEADSNAGNRVVYVSADMGAMFTAVKLEVIKRLQADFGDLYNDDNVMLAATHTHVGNAGYSHQQLYQIASTDDTLAGYSQQNFNAIVGGIVTSIKRAHESLTPGTLSVAQGKLKGATVNRSQIAYNNNVDAQEFDSNVNETMTQLRLDATDGTPMGLINWFALHPTSFSNQFMHLSADNKGYAQLGAEKLFNNNADRPFVAAFANADEGDVLAAGGNANSKPGFQGSDDEWENVRRDGQLQLDKAAELWHQGAPVAGPVDVRARWVDLKGYQVESRFTSGAGDKVLCTPARGYSFAAGGENGPSNIPGIYEGMTRASFRINDDINKVDQSLLASLTRGAFGIVSTVNQDDCQAEKQVLLPTGKWGWINTEQPVQLMRIGNIAIVAIPGEPTTMAGRRIRAAVLAQLKDAGVDTVIVNGLANNYSGYLSTREEFAAQHYEGASTEYGPYQTAAYIQEYSQLAEALRTGTDVPDSAAPPDRSHKSFHERTGVVFDDKPIHQRWGQVLTQPNPSYQSGEVATAVFRAAHPKNNLRTEDSFLKVQRYQDGQWVDYLSDRDFETTYTWQREGAAYSKAIIDWRIRADTPAGTYRLTHAGDWKSGWTGKIKPYSGASSSFRVQ